MANYKYNLKNLHREKQILSSCLPSKRRTKVDNLGTDVKLQWDLGPYLIRGGSIGPGWGFFVFVLFHSFKGFYYQIAKPAMGQNKKIYISLTSKNAAQI